MGEEALDYEVGVIAQTIVGDVVLKMTEQQASELCEALVWLTDYEVDR